MQMGTSSKSRLPADARGMSGGAVLGSRQTARVAKAAARRNAILDAALDEFSARGFAAARLDDVARRADVAKGTIYLHFKDKEALFQELIRFQMNPVVGTFEAALAGDLPLRVILDQAIEIFVREIYGTHRKEVMRLIITEGPRFPALAEFYYREVLARLLKALRARLTRALERGEIADDTLVRFPQLLGAVSVIAIVWHGLFDRFEPLDVRAMMRAYFDRLFPQPGRPA
jgi:AcrR family transcriptional regulator